jgi:excisionase family DNA binding protein
MEYEQNGQAAIAGDRLVSPRELAVFLSVSLAHVYGLTERGQIPSVKVGKVLRYSIPDVLVGLGKVKHTEPEDPAWTNPVKESNV